MLTNRRYVDEQGRAMFVTDAFSKGRAWFVGYEVASGAVRRFKSPACPVRETRDESQADLNTVAAERGWMEVTTHD